MDVADLYDHEIAKIGPVWQALMRRFSTKSNTKANLDELARVAADEFLKIGLIVEVDTSPTLIVTPQPDGSFRAGTPEIVVIGRVDALDSRHEGYDHERKRHEVLRSRERGEEFFGQKERARG